MMTDMVPAQLPGSPTYLQPGTPALAKFLLDLGYTTDEFGKNHLGDHTEALPDGARVSGILGLSLSPRRHADGELPRRQQKPKPARGRTGRARTRRSPAFPKSPAPSTPRARLA